MDDLFKDQIILNSIESILKQIDPTVVITITGQNDLLSSLNKTIDKKCCKATSELIVLPKSEYSYVFCLNAVRSVQINNEIMSDHQAGRIAYLNSFINFTSYCVTYALGLLLMYIDKSWNNIQQCKRMQYSSIKYFVM